jgi:hypothetical protein
MRNLGDAMFEAKLLPELVANCTGHVRIISCCFAAVAAHGACLHAPASALQRGTLLAAARGRARRRKAGAALDSLWFPHCPTWSVMISRGIVARCLNLSAEGRGAQDRGRPSASLLTLCPSCLFQAGASSRKTMAVEEVTVKGGMARLPF